MCTQVNVILLNANLLCYSVIDKATLKMYKVKPDITMSLCIRFKLNSQSHQTGRARELRQVNELNSMKSLYYEKQCNHKNPCENNKE